MVFLSPVPALIGAALALPTLLLFYFLKLRRRPVRVSSTMFWVAGTRDLQANVPFRWLRASWTLLMQLAILALLLLALGRPAIEAAGAPATRTILMIDRSASMLAPDAPGGVTRLEAAKARAIEIIDGVSRAGSGASVGVVAVGARPEVVARPTNEWRSLRRAVRAIEGTDQPADLAAALELVGAMATRSNASDEEAAPDPASVVLIGDGGQTPGESLVLAGAVPRFERVGPTIPEGIESVGGDNLGLAAISARRDLETPGVLRVFARVVNASDRSIDATVAASVNGDVRTRVPVTVMPAEGGEEAGLPLTLDLEVPGAALLTLSIERNDLLASDNRASVVAAAPSTPRVLHVVPGDEARADWILGDLLSELAGAGYRRTDIASYRRAREEGRGLDASVVVFDRVAPGSMPDVATITFGAVPPLAGLVGRDGAPVATRALGWDRSSAIMRDVSLDGLYVARAPDLDVDPDAGPAEVLATGRSGPLIVLLTRGGRRHLVVGFEPEQSNWPAAPGFVVFVANAVDALTNRAASITGRSYTTARPVTLEVPAGAEEVVLTGPETIRVGVSPGAAEAAARTSVGLVPRAGVYTIRGVEGVRGVVPVNLVDEAESLVRTRRTVEIGGRAIGASEGEGATREIWAWLVMAAAGLLVIEWFWVAVLNRV